MTFEEIAAETSRVAITEWVRANLFRGENIVSYDVLPESFFIKIANRIIDGMKDCKDIYDIFNVVIVNSPWPGWLKKPLTLDHIDEIAQDSIGFEFLYELITHYESGYSLHKITPSRNWSITKTIAKR